MRTISIWYSDFNDFKKLHHKVFGAIREKMLTIIDENNTHLIVEGKPDLLKWIYE